MVEFEHRRSAILHPYGSLQLVIAALVLLGLISGCTTRTVGMQAPLAHDYDGIQWRPLDATISQRIIVAPAYTAVVENDPATDPNTLVERIRNLPDDARSAKLTKILLALRPAEDRSFDRTLQVQVSVVGSDEPATFSTIDDLSFEEGWAVVSMFPFAFAGDMIDVRVGPATGWEYGITVDRVPYGGFQATASADGSTVQPLGGSLAFETHFEQATDRSRLLEEAVGPALRSAASDPFLIAVYAIILLLGSGTWLIRRSGMKAS